MRNALCLLLRHRWPQLAVHELAQLGEVAPAVERFGKPRLFCLDLKLPDARGVDGIRTLACHHPGVPVAVISAVPAHEQAQACMSAGAKLYIEKSSQAKDIVNALSRLLQQDEADTPDGPDPIPKLSRRQSQLLHMLEQGLSNRDIAERLELSEHTIKVHLWRMFRRLQVNSRTQAVHQARKNGLLGQ